MRVVFWGTYDTGKPRVRILLRGLRDGGVDVLECHRDVWGGIEDKSQVRGAARKAALLIRWIAAYPWLIWRYLRLPRHDAVLVGYLGQLDVLVLWPLAKLRGIPIVWDAFLSLYNTVVEDRKLVGPRHPVAWLLWAWEWLACKAVDLIILDTNAHAGYFVRTFGPRKDKVQRVFVGVEDNVFRPCADVSPPADHTPTILFYGQFIPLHGIETVVQAAKLTEADGIRWVIVGTGQEEPNIRTLIDRLRPANLEWIEWIPYERLVEIVHGADACLGIFGDTAKAAMVIPNKVFQILMSGKPMITRDSPAIRELLPREARGVWLVPPAAPAALAEAVRAAVRNPFEHPLHDEIRTQIAPVGVGRQLLGHLRRLLPNSA